MEEKLVGKITHYFTNIGVGVIEVTDGSLKVGDKIHIKGATSDFEMDVKEMQIDHESVDTAKKGQAVGMKVDEQVREGDEVFLIKD